MRSLNSSASKYVRNEVDQTCATSINKIAEIQVQSGVSAFKKPNCQPTARSKSDTIALPRKTDKSNFSRK